MKKLILTLFLVLGSLTIQAQELTWQTDINKAMEISKKSKKPLMLFFTGSDWCGWCIRLQKEVLKTPEFAKWAKDNVVLVELDFPRRTPQQPEIQKQNMELQQALGVRGYPTVWFVKASKKDGKINLEQIGSTGYVAGGPSAWLAGADQILAPKKS
ncbi:thioredoxin family protein [Flavobacterium sp. J49]|uniref:thioredoxin family protein n=1 Tax=Flavobacterium sp. J49 TaxID=2718534 RepID=UPI0015949BEA|nr:thioredoxin family protein [Flavobacterium sp. J49]MBF6641848.1 thioredoxin family protein [Flavobacterium sp. J49]NIC03095.1 thioredoxin family protein [Flavobacterium sp. J49]